MKGEICGSPRKADEERGRRIKDLIDKAGIKQTWLADRLGVSPEAIANWISGRTGIALENRRRLAEILGVDSAYIEFGKESPGSPAAEARSDRAILDSEPILLLGTMGPELSREALKEISRFIRFIHQEETERKQE